MYLVRHESREMSLPHLASEPLGVSGIHTRTPHEKEKDIRKGLLIMFWLLFVYYLVLNCLFDSSIVFLRCVLSVG